MTATDAATVHRALRKRVAESLSAVLPDSAIMLADRPSFDRRFRHYVQIVPGVPRYKYPNTDAGAVTEDVQIHVWRALELDRGEASDERLANANRGVQEVIRILRQPDDAGGIRGSYLNGVLYIQLRLITGSNATEDNDSEGYARMFDTWRMDYEV